MEIIRNNYCKKKNGKIYENNILTDSHFGFRTNSSTELAVTSIYDKLLQNLDDKKVDPVHDPEKHNSDWTRSRLDKIPTGQDSDWTRFQHHCFCRKIVCYTVLQSLQLYIPQQLLQREMFFI